MKKVLITGSMRSGTTFSGNLVNANDDCILLRDALLPIFRISKKLGITTFKEPISARAKNILLVNIKAEMSGFGIEKLHTISGEQFTNLEELFELLLNNLAEDTTKVIGVKVTEAEDWLETIIRDTNIFVIYLVRDLRDVLLSSNNRFPDYNRTTFAKKWFKGVSQAIAVKDDPKMFFLKFEDLIQNPVKEVKKLSNFLGVELDPTIKRLKDISNQNWIDNSSFHDLKETFDKKAIFRWKKEYSCDSIGCKDCRYLEEVVYGKLGGVAHPYYCTFREIYLGNITVNTAKCEDKTIQYKKAISKEVQYGSVVCRKLMKKLGYETNKISIIQILKIKIAHSIPFPRKRQAFIKKLVRLSQKLPAALFKEKKLVEEKKA